MAAGKSLWVKLRYRIRPSSALTTTGQALDPTKTEASIRTSLASPVFDNSLDFAFDPQPYLDMPSEASIIATSIELPHPIALPTPPMVPLTTAEILSPRKRRKGTSTAKRSLSTPNVNTQQHDDSGMSLAEKRRNKLGYHRTSIACSKFVYSTVWPRLTHGVSQAIVDGARSDVWLHQMIHTTGVQTAFV